MWILVHKIYCVWYILHSHVSIACNKCWIFQRVICPSMAWKGRPVQLAHQKPTPVKILKLQQIPHDIVVGGAAAVAAGAFVYCIVVHVWRTARPMADSKSQNNYESMWCAGHFTDSSDGLTQRWASQPLSKATHAEREWERESVHERSETGYIFA